MKQSPKERWESLRATLPDDPLSVPKDNIEAVLSEMEAIDKDTPWGNGAEPTWWLEMIGYQRSLYTILRGK